MTSLNTQIAQLETAIAIQETLRSTLGDAAVDSAIALMRSRLAQLRAQPSPTRQLVLHAQLQQLQYAGLIRLSAEQLETFYAFRHILTPEAAYHSLLTSERKELHRRVGSALELLSADQQVELPGMIIQHYYQAEAWEKAVEFLSQAGDAANRQYAHAEARLHYAKALEALSHLPDTEANRRRQADTLMQQVSVSLRADGPERNLSRLVQAQSIVEALPDTDLVPARLRLARIRYWLGHVELHRNQLPQAIQYLRQVLAVAQEFGDAQLLAIPAAVIGRALAIQGRFPAAEPLLAQAIRLLEAADNWHEWTLSMGFHRVCLAAQGQVAQAFTEGDRVLAQTTQLHYGTGIGLSHATRGLSCLLAGEYVRMLAEGAQASRSQTNPVTPCWPTFVMACWAGLRAA